MVKRKKALKGTNGSALFMVICVMAILMVVAITSMAMVSLAYTRSLQNYTASQSYITAVNTLDMITETTHYMGTGSSTSDYGQDEAAVVKISEPLREVLWECMGDSVKGGQVKYGTVNITEGPLKSNAETDAIHFVPLDGDPDDNGGNNICYEVLPAPANAADGKASVDPGNASAPECGYGESAYYNGRYYTHAKVKITVKVQSGSGDTAQIRTVSKVIDPMISWEETSTPTPPPTPPKTGGGLFDQAVKALGKYTSAPGVRVIGGISTKEKTDVSFEGLDEITKSMYINGNMATVNSGWSGEIKIGADKQIAVNGTLKVDNVMKFVSTFDPNAGSGSKPFIYCENIQWGNSPIPSGHIDIITKTGGLYGRDDNEIAGNVVSGGDLSLVGNNLKISGKIFVDGDVEIKNSLVNSGGTIYYTGNIKGNLNGVSAVKINAADYNFDVTNPKINPENGQMIIHAPDNSREYNVMTEESVFSSCYDDSGDIIPSYDYSKNNELDPTTGTIVVKDEEGNIIPEEDIIRINASSTGRIDVPVGKTIVFETTPGATTYISDLEIVVESGEGIVNIVQAPGDIDLKGVKIWSETVKDAVESGADLDVDVIAKDPEYSKIFWDVPEGSNVNLNSMDPGNLLNAYIYGPEANFAASTQNCGVNVKYGGSTDRVWLLGSVIGNDIDMGNGLGIIFIDPYANGEIGGGGETPETPPTPPVTPSTKKNFQQDVNNGNFYYTNR